MRPKQAVYIVFGVLLSGFLHFSARAQFLVDMIDTAISRDKGLWAVYKDADHLQISGYMQPQFQAAQSKGARNYSGGGDFPKFSNNRFLLRRGRLRIDYAHFTANGLPQAQVVFQIDGSEKGLFVRDFWGRYYENKWQLFAVTGGMFARPFGYELNLGSSDRESPERGRMSQILMRVERDLGAMITLEPRKKTSPIRFLKIDFGLFNGQGLTGPDEYDSYKDLIGRISLKPQRLSKTLSFSAGASLMHGGIVQNSKYIYSSAVVSGHSSFIVDSSAGNIGRKAPRQYYGVDAQLKIKNPWGITELRAEFWEGKQTSTALDSQTPGLLLNEPYYIRHFRGAFFYLLQNIVSSKHQLGLKYDWYDPNTKIQGKEIGDTYTNAHWADIKYGTIGIGYNYYMNKNIKLLLWYDWVMNEKTSLAGYTADAKDNIFTTRIQFRF